MFLFVPHVDDDLQAPSKVSQVNAGHFSVMILILKCIPFLRNVPFLSIFIPMCSNILQSHSLFVKRLHQEEDE